MSDKQPSGTQPSLFGVTERARFEPDGLAYEEDFLSVTQERELIALATSLPLDYAAYKEYTARRKVLSYGHSYDYDNNVLREAPAISDAFRPLRDRVARWAGAQPHDFVQLLLSEYAPGTPLGWHRDVPDYELVVGVSLGSAAKLRFRPYPHIPGARAALRTLEVAPRSIYSMRGAARWEWQHSVPPTPGQRWSLTFRTRSMRR